MTQKERCLIEGLLVKVDMLHEDIREVKDTFPHIRKRISYLERMASFSKGIAAVISVAVGGLTYYMHKFVGG